MSPLLKVPKIAITHLSLGLSPQNQQNFQRHEILLVQLIDKKICSCSFGEMCMTHQRTHAHTH